MTYVSGSITAITNPHAAGDTGHVTDHNNLVSAVSGHDLILSSASLLFSSSALLGSASSTISSSAFMSILNDETGTGQAVFNTSPTFTGTLSASNVTLTGNLTASVGNIYLSSTSSAGGLLIATTTGSQTLTNKTLTSASLSAGTSASAPLVIASGTNLAVPLAGAVEYDGTVAYLTTNTGASARGIVESSLIRVASASLALTNNTAAQPAFSASGTINLAANTTYEFEMQLIQSGSIAATSNTVSFLFGGTASTGTIAYNVISGTNTVGAASTTFSNVLTATAISIASTLQTRTFFIKGILRNPTAGTFIPQIQFSASPANGPYMAVGSYMKFIPIGASATTGTNGWA